MRKKVKKRYNLGGVRLSDEVREKVLKIYVETRAPTEKFAAWVRRRLLS